MFVQKPLNTLTTLVRSLDKIGATLPKPTAAEYDKFTALTADVRALDLRPNLAGAVLAALADGNDPMTDPAVQREATRSGIAAVRTTLDEALSLRAQDFINTHATTILEAMRKPFDVAAQAITEAHSELGDVALDDTHAILAKRGNAAGMWAQAKDADLTITNIHQTWGVLAGAAMAIDYQPMYRLLIIADVDAATWLDEGLRNSGLTAWDAVRAGHRLDYAAPETFRQRVQAIHQEQQRRAAYADGEVARGFQRTHGVGAA